MNMPCKKKYIDADNSLSAIDKAIKKYADNDDILEFLSEIRFAVIGQPAADVKEVRHGKWKCNKGDSAGKYYCSLCFEYGNPKQHYCGYCGAKMDGGEKYG